MRVPAARAIPIVASLAAALAASLALPLAVAGIDGSVLVNLAATKYSMSCSLSGSNEQCIHVGALPPTWQATISPAAGPLKTLVTDATTGGPPGDLGSKPWLADMHGTACGAPKAAGTFAAKLWSSAPGTTLGPTIVGNCTVTGSVTPDPFTGGKPFDYRMASRINPPKATPKPTPKPTPEPTPAPTATLAPSMAPSPTPDPSTAAPSMPPTSGPSATGPPAATAAPVASAPAGQPPGGPPPAGPPGGPTFSSSVLGLEDVNADGAAIGGSALLALLLLLFMGLPAELFNDTVEQNYDVISGWFKRGPLGLLRRLGGRANGWTGRHRRAWLVAFVGLTALISSFVDPGFGLNPGSLAEFLGFFVALAVVLASFKLPPMLAHRRRTGELGHLRPLPWALAIAALFVLVSRLGQLEPGYLYGIVLGALFSTEVPVREEGRETLFGSIWTLIAAIVGWLGLTWIRGVGLPAGDLAGIVASTAFAAILVLGLEATAFGLMPLRFLPGYAVYKFSRVAWAILFGLSVFAFLHLLIGPATGYLDHLTPNAFIAALGVFAAFGALSLGTWGYFRFRRPTPATADPAGLRPGE